MTPEERAVTVVLAEAIESARDKLVEAGMLKASELFAPLVLAVAQWEVEHLDRQRGSEQGELGRALVANLGLDARVASNILDACVEVDAEDLRESVEYELDMALQEQSDFVPFEALVFDRSHFVGRWDSSDSAVMTAGAAEMYGFEVRGKVFWREFGDDAMDPGYYGFVCDADDIAAREAAESDYLGQCSNAAGGDEPDNDAGPAERLDSA